MLYHSIFINTKMEIMSDVIEIQMSSVISLYIIIYKIEFSEHFIPTIVSLTF